MHRDARSFLLDVVGAGGFAGLLGGLLMLAVYMPASVATGGGFWSWPKMLSSLLFRAGSLEELGVAAVVFGLALHFAVAVALGIPFAAFIPRGGSTRFPVVAFGVMYGLANYLVMSFLVDHWAMPLLEERVTEPLLLAASLAYGAALAVIAPLRTARERLLRFIPLSRRGPTRA
jgi:hypothetical protein